jgi:hypothetical protein
MARRTETYDCVIERDEDGRVLTFTLRAVDLEGVERSVRVNGTRATRIAASVHDVLREAGISGRTWSGSRPIDLPHVSGAHTELLLQAVKPLQRSDRIDQVAAGVAQMSCEEASYWHAKTRRPGGLRALRILMTQGAVG